MEEQDKPQVSIEEAKLAVDIFKKALEYRSFIKPAIVGHEFLSLSIQDRLAETMTPRIGLTMVVAILLRDLTH